MAIFASLSEKLSSSIKKISGKASLSEKNIQDTLREVRIALLEADVALPVVKNFLSDVKDRALGTEVSSSLDPGQQFLKIEKRKNIMMVSTDIYRPAAIEQLRILSEEVDVDFFQSRVSQKPKDILNAAIAAAKKQFIDVLIIDTAGRLSLIHI